MTQNQEFPSVTELDGATTPAPENAYPVNPGEFAASWNTWTEDQRARWLQNRIETSQAAIRCFVQDHDGELDRLESKVESLRAQFPGAWQDGYDTGQRDYAGSIMGGAAISTSNPWLEVTG